MPHHIYPIPPLHYHPITPLELKMRAVMEGMEEFTSGFGLPPLFLDHLDIEEFEIVRQHEASTQGSSVVIPFPIQS